MDRTRKLQLIYLLNTYKYENLDILEKALNKADTGLQVMIENHLRNIENVKAMLECEVEIDK